MRHTLRVKPGEIVEAHVVVRNLGVGHRFPAGTTDSNEIWLEFRASVGDRTFYVSGAVDPNSKTVDATAEHYRSYAVTREGKRFVSRVGVDVYTPLYSRRLGPGTADIVRYRFRVPPDAKGELKLDARMRYRKFMMPYIDFLFPESKIIKHRQMDGTMADVDLMNLPIIDMAEGRLSLPIHADGTSGAPPPASDVAMANDRVFVNDLAIGYLLQGSPAAALPLFQEVTKIDPAYADGWVNVGRAHEALSQFTEARRAMRTADRLKPGWAKTRLLSRTHCREGGQV